MAPWTRSYSNYGWFDDKICKCLNDDGIYGNHYDWSTLNRWQEPPFCKNCGKWADRVMICIICRGPFYQLFSHPSMGFHDKPIRGWYCWNCLEIENPPVVEKAAAARKKVAPPSLVIPPGYEIYVPVDYFAHVKKRL